MSYRQEYDKGNAEDNASVTSVDAKAKVPFGSFDHVLQTRDVNPLETNFVEHKSFARGVGADRDDPGLRRKRARGAAQLPALRPAYLWISTEAVWSV